MRRAVNLKNIIFCVISLFAVIVLNFFLPRLMPGDAVVNLVGLEGEYVSAELYDYYYVSLGLDKPIFTQFIKYLGDVFTGRLGYSYGYERTVGSLIGERISATLQIALPAVIISSLLALYLGINAGYKQGGLLDKTITGASLFVNAIPSFLLAIILILVFAYNLGWLPYGSLNSPDAEVGWFWDRLWHLVLPITTLVLLSFPSKYFMARNCTVAAIDDKYVIYAKARGLSNAKIKYRHVLVNVCQPFIVMVGTSFGKILSGSVIIETVFSVQGMGTLMTGAIYSQDYPVLQGCLFVTAVMAIIANLITDVVCVALDARQRLGEANNG